MIYFPKIPACELACPICGPKTAEHAYCGPPPAEASARAALRRRSVADGCRNVSAKYYFQFLIFHFSSMISFTDYALAVYPFLELSVPRTYYRVLEAFAEGRVRRLMISMPPQHGKSVGATTLLPAYLLGLDPDLRIAIASYSASLASKFNRRVQRILCSAEYGELFPTRRSSAARNRPNTSARPTKSRSWGTRAVCCRSAARVRSRQPRRLFPARRPL